MTSPSESDKKTNHWLSLTITLVLVAAAVVFLTREMNQVRSFIANSGWIGMLAAILVYGLLGASPVPSEPLTVLLSTVFGPFSAMIVSGLGNLLAAAVEYYIGAHIGNATSFTQQREKLPFGLGKMPVESPVFLIVARMVPGYGSKFVSLIGGIYHVPLYRYLWTAAIPTFLGTAIFAYGGFGLFQLGRGH